VANDSGVQPGWYADPLGRFELRYYNGAAWTADVSSAGDRFVDPLGLDLGPGVAADIVVPGGSAANRPATAAMVLGIIAVAIAWLPFVVVLGLIAAVLALVFGAVGLRRSSATGAGRSRAIVGLVTGACGMVAAALGVVMTLIVLDVYRDYVDPSPNDVGITSCETVGSRAIASGTLVNLGAAPADFSVLIGFVRPGTDNAHRAVRAVLDDVKPGQRAEFRVERQVDLETVDCIVIGVNGPLPFGLSLD
jgi:hypothetical protein